MSRWVEAMRLTGVGFFIGVCIVGGIWGGWWLDGKLNTKPVFMIIGVVVGLVVAAYGVYRMIRPLMGDKQDKENG